MPKSMAFDDLAGSLCTVLKHVFYDIANYSFLVSHSIFFSQSMTAAELYVS